MVPFEFMESGIPMVFYKFFFLAHAGVFLHNLQVKVPQGSTRNSFG